MNHTVIAAVIGSVVGGSIVNCARRYEFRTKFAKSNKIIDSQELLIEFQRWCIKVLPILPTSEMNDTLREYAAFVEQVIDK
jgi:hypothetical protein